VIIDGDGQILTSPGAASDGEVLTGHGLQWIIAHEGCIYTWIAKLKDVLVFLANKPVRYILPSLSGGGVTACYWPFNELFPLQQ